VRKHCSLVLQIQGFSFACQSPLHHCFLRLLLNPLRFCLQQLGSVGCQLLLLLLLNCCFLLGCRWLNKASCVLLKLPLQSNCCCCYCGCCCGGEGDGEEAGGPFVAHDLLRPKTLIYINLAQPCKVKKYLLMLTAFTPQAKKQYICGVIKKGTYMHL